MTDKDETLQPTRSFVSGWEQPCAGCPFKDFYFAQKNLGNLNQIAQQQSIKIKELEEQLKPDEESDE